MLFPNDEEVANSSKKINPIQDECTNHTLVEIDTLFRTKTAKNIPFGAAHAYIAYIRDYPRGENALEIMSPAAYASETNNT